MKFLTMHNLYALKLDEGLIIKGCAYIFYTRQISQSSAMLVSNDFTGIFYIFVIIT